MICVICKNGETEPGVTTSTLEQDSTITFVTKVPANVCNNCGEAYIDSQTLVRLHNMSPENSEQDDEVDVVVLKYADQSPNGTTVSRREQLTLDFVKKIDRRVRTIPKPKHNGYDLAKPGVRPRIGFVRANVNGTYTVYAYEPRSDPEDRFVNESANNHPRGWKYIFNQDDRKAFRYAVTALEAGYDLRK